VSRYRPNLSGYRLSKMDTGYQKWIQAIKNGYRLSKMDTGYQKWIQAIKNGYMLSSNGYRRPQRDTGYVSLGYVSRGGRLGLDICQYFRLGFAQPEILTYIQT
jgi:hypothetical protein